MLDLQSRSGGIRWTNACRLSVDGAAREDIRIVRSRTRGCGCTCRGQQSLNAHASVAPWCDTHSCHTPRLFCTCIRISDAFAGQGGQMPARRDGLWTREFTVKKIVLIGSGMLLLSAMSPASAGPNCASFISNTDGSWSPTHPFMFATPTSQTQLMPSDRMLPQMPGARGHLARYLNASCRSERASVGVRRIPLNP